MKSAIERENPYFTPITTDHINKTLQLIDDKVKNLYVPKLEHKEVVSTFEVSLNSQNWNYSWAYNSEWTARNWMTMTPTKVSDTSFSIGPVHFLNVSYTASYTQSSGYYDSAGNKEPYESPSLTGYYIYRGSDAKFRKIGSVSIPPNHDVIFYSNDNGTKAPVLGDQNQELMFIIKAGSKDILCGVRGSIKETPTEISFNVMYIS